MQRAFEKRDERGEAQAQSLQRLWHLTFDMRGAQKAQPFGHPLDGRVRPRQSRKGAIPLRSPDQDELLLEPVLAF